MLDIHKLSKVFPSGAVGISEVSLSLDGGVLGLLGANGAGKTTLMQMLATITPPTAGQIRFQDVDILRQPDYLRRRLGYLPQDFGVYDNLTAFEFLNYFAALKGVSSRARVLEMLELVNLHTVAHRSAGTFSGGMKQRLGIAQALINNPDLLIVDEPTAGLDPEERVRFRNLLGDIGSGKLVILSTHIVSDIESIATMIAVIKKGRLLACAPPEALLATTGGRVWEAVLSSAQFDGIRSSLKVSAAVRKPDGIHARIVAQDRPLQNAVPVEANLEDAFLYLMNFAPAAFG
ncbi:ABC transporter ATP-binding protein [Gloeobacter morelensis]|uniref:ABC transporter ATP-binding protein n=1 Tax=Gloeobacter morelensis MG652769 TaxID=2781736 RepID=A0ABY3PPI7_9CYAN|nr:ABC transporter ATP-binding protein [Gloeobacter morelensis]UFP95448.1 ABC transporter ATP-binding protein [Gloeobacter morelensis MG652769]